jgi:hypothetical protein
MLQNDHSIPKEYGTPLRKRQKEEQQSQEDDCDCSQGRSSITKSSCSPSTTDSPLLQPHGEAPFYDIDLSSVLFDEEDLAERCGDFFERGWCPRGGDCHDSHKEFSTIHRASNYKLLSNFPELVATKAQLRVRSFLE